MKLVIIESPYSGDIERNKEYARRAMVDCICRGEVPFASHLLYTQVLDDNQQDQRTAGILLGFEVATKADLTAVYTDYGTSAGMVEGIKNAVDNGREIEYRSIGKNFMDDDNEENRMIKLIYWLLHWRWAVCRECKHYIDSNNSWLFDKCKKHDENQVNPITGKVVNKYQRCWDYNCDGTCWEFEPKKQEIKPSESWPRQ